MTAPRFQAPPNWPPPPPGWVPPPGWRPEASWGPAPEGWQFWVEDRPAKANPDGWRRALLSALGWYVVLLVVRVLVTGGLDAEAAGASSTAFLLGGLLTGVVASGMSSRWPLWLYPIVVLIPSVLLSGLVAVGQATR